MIEVVGVRYHDVGQIYFYAPKKQTYTINDQVIVESQDAKCLATVVTKSRKMDESDLPQIVKPILRRATKKDLEQAAANQQAADEALKIGKEKIWAHQLPMKLIRVAYTFERTKLIFSFTAESRVDFRELVKDLASEFHTRIELRQIGVRDEA